MLFGPNILGPTKVDLFVFFEVPLGQLFGDKTICHIKVQNQGGWKNSLLFVASLFDNGKPWPSKPMPGGMLYGGVRSPWWTNGGGSV